MRETLCVILGGGRGTRLNPLTKMRSKPAVPLAGKYRLIDIPISNSLNSGLNKIFILTQFNSESLNRHIQLTYRLDAFSKGFVEIIAAEQSVDNSNWFQGTCDAVRQCLRHFTDKHIKEILILSGDHLYRADYTKIIAARTQAKSDVIVACMPVPQSMASHFGIMQTRGGKIVSFHEKPKEKAEQEPLCFDLKGEKYCLASMGIYLFDKNALIDLLQKNPDMTDFGKELIPQALKQYNVTAYNFEGYWADIGTIKSFYEASMLLTSSNPPINLYDENWPIFTHPRYLPPSRITGSRIDSSVIGDGCIIENSEITSSIIGLRSNIGAGSKIKSSIIMGSDFYTNGEKGNFHIGENCLIENAIIDKNVVIGNNVVISNQAGKADYEFGCVTVRDGIAVIEKNSNIPDGFKI